MYRTFFNCAIFLIVPALWFSGSGLFAQQTLLTADQYQRYQQAKTWFHEEHYALAYPVVKEIETTIRTPEFLNSQLYTNEVAFYAIACELMQMNEAAEKNARDFLNAGNSAILKGQLGYYLGMYHFRKEQYADALEAFGQASISNLNNRQVGDMQFAQGYCYFSQKQFSEAKPLLNSVRQVPEHRRYTDANYYYGLLAFNEGRFSEALKSFDIAKKDPKYQPLVPYYSATINYSTGQKDKGIELAEAALKNPNTMYASELRRLAGHGYFEKGQYAKALPLLEAYQKETPSISRTDAYELGYCYYQAAKYSQSINMFKPLAGGQDSLSQHAMYMLGDAYLKTGDKASARNAFLFCADNFSYPAYKEISKFNYGKLSYELGYDNEALGALRQYVQEHPSGRYTTEAKEHLINLLAKSSNYKDALSLYESITVQNDRTRRLYPVILFNRGQQLLADRDLSGANALFDKAIAAPYSDDVKQLASFWKGEIAFAREQYADAAALYTQYLRKPVVAGEVSADNAIYNLGHAYLRLEQYAKARAEFEKLAGKRLQSADLQEDVSARLADCVYMQKDFRKAQSIYQPLSAAGGKQADYATYQLGMIAGAQGRAADKISTLRTLETLFPASMLVIPSQMEIANSYLADEKYKDALPFLQKIIQGKGGDYLKPEAYLKAGIAHFNLDNNKDALDYFSALLKQYPNAPESEDAIDNIRSIYVEQGKPDEFVKYMQGIGRAVNQQTADSLSYATAELQMSEGKKEVAMQSLKSYLQQYPQGRYAVEAHFNLAELSREKGDMAQALLSYEQVIALAPNKYAERCLLAASRMAYFDKKDYKLASGYYKQLKESATSAANKLEGMRGLVRCQYYMESYADAVDNARELMNQQGAGADDKIFASLVLGKYAQSTGNCAEAVGHYRTVSSLSKAEYGAEARYQTAACLYAQGRYAEAEKAAFEVVKKDGSYVLWVTRSYLLLGDIFLAQKDYFNAKATYKSVAENSSIKELKDEAAEKLVKAEAEEAASSKVTGN